ncbi:hypothetical protein Pla22_47530 [Rubripirellula amarantea]|uniref:Uncharacterized protein n=1 Tax=Rubripirellula amarantea TaxID=2527999 RepID=A0A5C5WFB7_9BACT|nr:hypothetical protein Pla22_47530 [Rubripirellula amarantea]
MLSRWPWIPPTLALIGRLGFWLGVFLILNGSIITFVPGAECGWFVTAGLVTATGALVPKWRYRVAAIVLCALCFYWAYAGYVRGINYQEWLKSRGNVSQSVSPHNMVFTLGPSAHLGSLATALGLGTISCSSGIVRFV